MKMEIKITEPTVRGEGGREKKRGERDRGGDGRDEMRDGEDKVG